MNTHFSYFLQNFNRDFIIETSNADFQHIRGRNETLNLSYLNIFRNFKDEYTF